MKRTLLLSSAVIALSLGLTPAMAQQDRTDSKMKRDPAATEQHDKNTSKHTTATKDETGAAKTTGQPDSDKAKAAETDKAKSGADSAKAPEKAAGSEKSTAQPKSAEEQTKKPATDAATNKANTAEPSKNAQQNSTRSPDAQKSTQSAEPNRNAAANNAEPKTRISASLDPQKKTRVTTAFDKVNVRPVTNVNFSVSVGVAVPRTIEVHPVPTTIVEIVPQYRGYDFFVVREEIVIVEPRTHKIVDVIERGSHARAESTTTVRSKPQLSSQQREIIRRHATSRRTTTTTTGVAPRTTTSVTIGERLPDSVEIESFPEEVYREVPSVREYRYIERGDDMYLVDPTSRTVIEEVR